MNVEEGYAENSHRFQCEFQEWQTWCEMGITGMGHCRGVNVAVGVVARTPPSLAEDEAIKDRLQKHGAK